MKLTLSTGEGILLALAFGNIVITFFDKSEWGNRIRAVCGWGTVIIFLLF